MRSKSSSNDAALLRDEYSDVSQAAAPVTARVETADLGAKQDAADLKTPAEAAGPKGEPALPEAEPAVSEANPAVPEAKPAVSEAKLAGPESEPEKQLKFHRSSNASNDEMVENLSNTADKKKKKKGMEEPAIPKVEERKAFSISTQLYRFGEHLAMYNRLYQETYPQLMCSNCKFYIETENNGVGCLDLLFTAFCDFMKMEKIKNLPTDGGERVFCWLGKRKATEILPTLRPEHHFVNRLPLDIYLKDKQSLAFTLLKNSLQKGAQFPPHLCPHSLTRVPCQILCQHQYARHSMEPCTEPGCFEALSKEAQNELGIAKLHSGPLCPCFCSQLYVPETKVFSSSLQQNVFIDDVSRIAPDAHWIVKPSYMRSGKGVRVLSSAEQLRTFLKVKTSNRFMWGQNFVVQRYIKNPMLTNSGQKFDIRMFLLIIVTRFKRVLGFLHPGYVRKVPEPYQQLQKDEKFRARRHLAGTRVWRTYGPKVQTQPPPPTPESNHNTPEALDTTETKPTSTEELNSQNNAKKKKKRKPSVALDPAEPVNLVGFYAQDFTMDECEEYNYAVRHGCLKGNKQNLPLILTPTKLPEHNPKPQKPKKNSTAVTADVSTSDIGSTGRATTAAGAETASPSAIRTSTGSSNVNANAAPAGASMETGSKTTESINISNASTVAPTEASADQDQAAAMPGEDPFAHFSANQEFLRSLRSMVCSICTRIQDQIKDRANCYQLFSLDMCVDDEGKPWLLEVNPSIITENVNWNSRTIREVIPGVLIESLALVCETTRKGLNFLALRTPEQFYSKPQDLVFRQNFLWLYSTPDRHCDLFELRRLKYAVEKQFKNDLTSRGISYFPTDYYPEKNQKLVKAVASEAVKKALDQSGNRCTYRFPSPVAKIPVLEEDIAFSLRYTRVPVDAMKRQTRVRRLEREVEKQRLMNEEARYKAFYEKKHKPKALLKERFILN